MEISIKEEFHVATFKHSDDFDTLNDVKEELCSDDLSDVDSIKMEEHDLKEFIRESLKKEKEHILENSFEIDQKTSLIAHVENTSSKKLHSERQQLMHEGEKRFKCALCDYTSLSKCNFTRHLLVHTNEKRFKCSLCDYESTRSNNYKKHLLIHTDERSFMYVGIHVCVKVA